MKSSDIVAKQGSLLFLSAIFSLLVGYHKLISSRVANQNAECVLDR